MTAELNRPKFGNLTELDEQSGSGNSESVKAKLKQELALAEKNKKPAPLRMFLWADKTDSASPSLSPFLLLQSSVEVLQLLF